MTRNDPEEFSDVQEPIRVALSNDYAAGASGSGADAGASPQPGSDRGSLDLAEAAARLDVILYDTFGRLPDEDPKLRKIVEENSAKVVVYSWRTTPRKRRDAAEQPATCTRA